MKTSIKRMFSRVSSILRPVNKYEKYPCHSQTLMMNEGLIFPGLPGSYNLLPLTVMSLEKLTNLVDYHMKSINGQKVIMPTLASKALWSASGRWDKMGEELLRLVDRNGQDLCLGPTHEETVTDLLVNLPRYTFKNLPLKIYQITAKFRDEPRPKMGLLRGREFIMKDMYGFDKDQKNAEKTYNQVCQAYQDLFKNLGVAVQKVKGSSGTMGGSFSQEFHIISKVGEDSLRICNSCDYGENSEIENLDDKCPKCGCSLRTETGIEVAHAFVLGEMYSEALGAKYLSSSGKLEYYHMSCFGLGITRIIAAIIEAFSTAEEIRWPLKISPTLVGIIPPKDGSKEVAATSWAKHFAENLSTVPVYQNNVWYDDRIDMTIGKRVKDLKALGIPYLIVIGKKACEEIPKFEVIDVYNDKTTFLTHAETTNFFRETAREIAKEDLKL